MDAIGKLSNLSDDSKLRSSVSTTSSLQHFSKSHFQTIDNPCPWMSDDSSDHRRKQHQCSNEERNGNIQGFQIGPYEQLDRSRIRHGEGFTVDRAERAGIPRINFGSRDYC